MTTLPAHVTKNLSRGRLPLAGRRAAHDREGRQAAILSMLHAHFFEHDVVLEGWPAIAGFLLTLGFHGQPAGRPVTPSTIRKWAKRSGFPLVGGRNARKLPVTSTFAVTAWWLSHHDRGALPQAYRGPHAGDQARP